MTNIFAIVGHLFFCFLQYIGQISLFIYQSFASSFKERFYFKEVWKQALVIGYFSIPVIGLTAIFTGAVLALQSYSGFSRFNAESSIASVVVLSITRELGPVLAGLMLAGRVGAAIAAEIGTMKVTEQLDALYTLGSNPFAFLFFPRIIAGIITLPILVIIADVIGVMGGYLVSVYKLGFTNVTYLRNTFDFMQYWDVVSGLIKAAVFGFIVTSIGCYCGYYSGKGAQGVGSATTSAVVTSSVLILCANYIITGLVFAI